MQSALQALKNGGFRAEYGYPGRKLPEIENVAATVNLHSADLQQDTQTVLVQIMAPAGLGAVACEEGALNAAALLQDIGGKCTVSACTADSRTGLLSAAVTAVFPVRGLKIVLGTQALPYAVSFTSGREVSETITDLSVADWSFRLEEFYPPDAEEPADPGDSFDLWVGEKEYYGACTFVSEQRITDGTGTRRIREGTALAWKIG